MLIPSFKNVHSYIYNLNTTVHIRTYKENRALTWCPQVLVLSLYVHKYDSYHVSTYERIIG